MKSKERLAQEYVEKQMPLKQPLSNLLYHAYLAGWEAGYGIALVRSYETYEATKRLGTTWFDQQMKKLADPVRPEPEEKDDERCSPTNNDAS